MCTIWCICTIYIAYTMCTIWCTCTIYIAYTMYTIWCMCTIYIAYTMYTIWCMCTIYIVHLCIYINGATLKRSWASCPSAVAAQYPAQTPKLPSPTVGPQRSHPVRLLPQTLDVKTGQRDLGRARATPPQRAVCKGLQASSYCDCQAENENAVWKKSLCRSLSPSLLVNTRPLHPISVS